MDSSTPNEFAKAIAHAEASLRSVSDALLCGGAIASLDMLRVLGAVRHVKAELETLDQVLANMQQK